MINFKKEYQLLVLPILKNLHVFAGVVLVVLYIARNNIRYIAPLYQASGTIKLDNRDYGISNFGVYQSEGMPMAGVDVRTEVEIFKSRQLKRAAFKLLDFETSYFEAQPALKELHNKTPLKVDFHPFDKKHLNKKIYTKYIGDNHFLVGITPDKLQDTVLTGIPYMSDWMHIRIDTTAKETNPKRKKLKKNDLFVFVKNDLDQLVSSVNGDNLFVKALDKEMTIVKLYFEHEVPEKAQQIVNALMQAYILQSQGNKTNQADKTLNFINTELDSVSWQLQYAEQRLVAFQSRQNIMNTALETDAKLKKRMQLEINHINLGLKVAELENLQNFIQSGTDFEDFSPNFEALNDPIFKETYSNIQAYELQKKDALLKYTPQSEEVIALENKINNLKRFLTSSIQNTLQNFQEQHTELDNILVNINQQLRQLPSKEQQITNLKRNIAIYEQTYTYLSEKRIALQIARSANANFHQIIDEATLPKRSSWPNKPLIYGVAIFLGLIIATVLSYLLHYFFGKVSNPDDIQTILEDTPSFGTIPYAQTPKKINFGAFDAHLRIFMQQNPKQTIQIGITSIQNNDGKQTLAQHLEHFFQKEGISTIILNDLSTIHQHTNEKQPENIQFKIFVLPPVTKTPEAAAILHQTDLNLLLFRSGYTRINNIRKAKKAIQEYNIPKLHTVLNGAGYSPLKKIFYELSKHMKTALSKF